MLHARGGITAEFRRRPLVSLAPDLRQTDGGVKPVEYDERDAQVVDDAPRQVPVLVRVHLEVLGRLDLEDGEDPEAEVEQEKEGDERAAGFELGLCRRVDSAVTGVDYEQRLQGRL